MILSGNGTFVRRGDIFFGQGDIFCRTSRHLVKTSLWPQQVSVAQCQFGNTSKTWRQPIPAYMQSFVGIGAAVSDNLMNKGTFVGQGDILSDKGTFFVGQGDI